MKKLKKVAFSANTEILNDFQMKNVLGGSNSDCKDTISGDCKTGKTCMAYYGPGHCGWKNDGGIMYCVCLDK